ncbi:hypothetical protein H5P28_11785 [Ruficoccus amylovorans]|uniref:Uncharacterized protein n=1 Tax=Ruficoccus amylovorans TaxID=1804625 RepID=A0A842HFX7_9BACT|nr:hypothetical protein [Ruficoccus amylovorans]MBC2594938.1 hypothetical protein [Ruficoccus amylovorans]
MSSNTSITAERSKELSRAERVLAAASAPVFESRAVERAKKVLESALKAEKSVLVGRGRNHKVEFHPDFPTQLRAAQLVLAYAHGTPVQRVASQAHIVTDKSEPEASKSPDQLMAAIEGNPALLVRILEDYKARLIQQKAVDVEEIEEADAEQ